MSQYEDVTSNLPDEKLKDNTSMLQCHDSHLSIGINIQTMQSFTFPTASQRDIPPA